MLQALPVYAATGNIVLAYNLICLSTFVLGSAGGGGWGGGMFFVPFAVLYCAYEMLARCPDGAVPPVGAQGEPSRCLRTGVYPSPSACAAVTLAPESSATSRRRRGCRRHR